MVYFRAVMSALLVLTANIGGCAMHNNYKYPKSTYKHGGMWTVPDNGEVMTRPPGTTYHFVGTTRHGGPYYYTVRVND